MSNKAILVVTTPFEKVAAGAFIRNAKALPYFSQLLARQGYSVLLHIPVNSVVSSISLLLHSGLGLKEAIKILANEAARIKKLSYIEAPLLDNSIENGIKLMTSLMKQPSLLKRIKRFGYLYIHGIRNIENKAVTKLINSVHVSKTVFVYSMNENLEHFITAYELCTKLRRRCAIMLQQPLYSIPSRFLSSKLMTSLATLQLNQWIRSTFIKLARKGHMASVFSVSAAPLLESGDLVNIVKRYGIRITIPKPPVAIDEKILGMRTINERPPIAVFFGRLSPRKGIYDLLRAWYLVEKEEPEAELWIIGAFHNEGDKQRFFRIMHSMRLRNVKYLGFFRSREKLYHTIKKAKVLIYPSYEDAFPLVVLEALALGLLVVAYNIPAIKYSYRGVPGIRSVQVGNIVALAKEAVHMLRLDYSNYLRIHSNPYLLKFIRLHSSWHNVGFAEAKELLRVIPSSLPY